MAETTGAYGDSPTWQPTRPKLRPVLLIVRWLIGTTALLVGAWIVPGATVKGFGAAFVAAAIIAVMNALLPPIIAALRIPFTLFLGFVLVLALDIVMLLLADDITNGDLTINSAWSALGVALVTSAVMIALEAIVGTNDDDTFTVRVIQRIARRTGDAVHTDVPGIVMLQIDGLAAPVLRRAMRDGNAPNLARWVAEGSHHLIEWEPDLSSQTGASQCGIIMGSNDNIPAFRWVEKATATLRACSSMQDCALIEERHGGDGLLVGGGASRGNLFSGGAEHIILTVSRTDAEKKANPGYRAFFANGFNVIRALVLFIFEVILELIAAVRAARRDVQPRGHRGGKYPLVRGALCVVLRDLIVFGILTDMMSGRPAVYATFSGYDEVAHHSGLERADTLEALRKLDEQLGRIERARKYAARPYALVLLSDHGQTQGATFLQRNGYGLDELVRRSVATDSVRDELGGDENNTAVGHAVAEATGRRKAPKPAANDVSGEDVVVLGSGNLGLVYLMDLPRRLTLEEIEERHPLLLGALLDHPHIGWLLVRSSAHGALALGANGTHYLTEGRVVGVDPLANFSSGAPGHLLRTDGFADVADIMIGSFYDPVLDEGCAFEELICFHGGLGGPQTRPFLLYPADLPPPPGPLVGAASVHGVLKGWRQMFQGSDRKAPTQREPAVPVAD